MTRVDTPSTSLPLDLRLMRQATRAVWWLLALLGLAAAGVWVAHRPVFDFGGIQIQGQLQRSAVADLRASVLPQLAGNFVTMDLQRTREVFESAPWIRRAVVRRVFPNRLLVVVEEHQPVALWREPGEPDRLLNHLGEVFEADLGEVDGLPTLEGGAGQAGRLLDMYRMLQHRLRALDSAPVRVSLSGRGAWETELRNGEVIVLGQGNEAQVLGRLDTFMATLSQVLARGGSATWVRADLRYRNGYAVQWKPQPTESGRRGAQGHRG
ncbi:cell division protein FtsQ/DivIB [Ideonella livida]|uniref:Cell division protein FtsQ n=1 Tax=Ideonella livida TaxID=2707176 RepID=A0A7C9TN83_9BURK|nr:cell division protein FtsQ/DivIB [Ideonella livida]NDY92286.1 FtsQ-type POTRA domain-containing protein [Ideonella livida]